MKCEICGKELSGGVYMLDDIAVCEECYEREAMEAELELLAEEVMDMEENGFSKAEISRYAEEAITDVIHC